MLLLFVWTCSSSTTMRGCSEENWQYSSTNEETKYVRIIEMYGVKWEERFIEARDKVIIYTKMKAKLRIEEMSNLKLNYLDLRNAKVTEKMESSMSCP